MTRMIELCSAGCGIALAVVAASACADSERVDPVTRVVAGEPPDGGNVPPPSDDAGTPGAARRSVTSSNPFGGPPTNLLVDGDFELSIVRDGDTGQYGWIGFSNQSAVTIKAETGGLCRTGLRCASIDRETFLFGRGAAALGAPLAASIYVKVPSGAACKDIRAYLVGCDSFLTLKKLVPDEAPGSDGWCAHEAKIAAQQSGVCMYVDASGLAPKARALVDSAVMIADNGTSLKLGEPWTPSAQDAARLATIRDHLRRHRFDEPARSPPRSRGDE